MSKENPIVFLQGDCRKVLRKLGENSMDSVVTDPPYNLKFMGKAWDATGIAFQPEMWKEVLRVLKPGGHLLAMGGTRTHHRLWCAVEDAGFEIRDTLMWLYGSGFPKSHNLKSKWKGWGTALKPAWEPILLARKPLIGTVAVNVQAHGTGAVNVDGCRTEGQPESTRFNPQNHQHEGWRFTATGKETAQAAIKKSGRWPAHLVLDEDAAVMLDAQTGTLKSGMDCTRRKEGYWGAGDDKHGGLGKDGDEQVTYGDAGGASRFFYCAKASRKERGEGNNHPTVKPLALMRWLVRLITPPGGKVLDPFIGSGTTALAAKEEGFRCVGIDTSDEYLEIARQRCGNGGCKHA